MSTYTPLDVPRPHLRRAVIITARASVVDLLDYDLPDNAFHAEGVNTTAHCKL
jgi:hypothetical protein